MTATNEPTLTFEVEFDERTAYEVEQKGFFEHAIAHLPDGTQIRLCFWDPIRLAQDLATEEKLGRVSFAEPGLIIVSRITVDNMKKAVAEQYKRGYFNRLRSFVLGQN